MQHLIAIALAVGITTATTRPPPPPEVNAKVDKFGQTIQYEGRTSSSTPSSSGSRASTSPQTPSFKVAIPELGSAADGQPCIETVARSYGTPEAAAAADAAQEQRWLTLVGQGYPLCPGVTAPAGNPVAMALQFWGEVPLPVPAPHIAPGRAITGLPAYLETEGMTAKDFGRGTPLGPISIGAHGRFYVDWGDGTHDGPFDVVGAPWPDGTISHTYTKTGAYDVVVTERWTATWSLAGRGGPLGGLQTVGRISQFPVDEVQAVRNR